MKINVLRIHNLNSLRGTFALDFDAPPLGSSALFAITGATGAGKSTLLDAICVALYGQTPRLAIGESEELMSRHTGECWAEVEFTVKRGRFRSKWSQRRARGRADGRLQPAAMELAVLREGRAELLEEKKSRVVQEVAELTGLDFNRFTRSVLLAQGSFAAFLQARDNERADLLERITGTEEYSRISRLIYRKTMEEEQKLQKLAAGLQAVELLSEDEVAALRTQEAVALEKIGGLGREVERIDNELQWLAARHQAHEESLAARQELADVEEERRQAADELQRLALARRALVVKGEYDVLQERRRRREEISGVITGLEKRLTGLADEEKECLALLATREAKYALLLGQSEELEEILRRVERLDELIAGQQRHLTERTEIVARISDDLEGTARRQAQIAGRIDDLAAQQNRCLHYLEGHREDGQLRRDFSLLCSRLDELAGLRDERSETQRRLKKLAAMEEEKKKDLTGLEGNRAARLREDEQLRLASRQIGEEIARFRSEGDPSPQARLQLLEIRLLRLNALMENGRQWEEARRRGNAAAAERERLEAAIVADSEQREKLVSEKGRAEEGLGELERAARLAERAAGYAEERGDLRAGEPCPLCGSLQHPWQGEKRESAGEEHARLFEVRDRIRRLDEEARACGERLAALAAGCRHSREAHDEWMARASELREGWDDEAAREGVSFPPEQWQEIGALLAAGEKERERCRRQAAAIATLERRATEVAAARDALIALEQEETVTRQRLEKELAGLQGEQRHFVDRLAAMKVKFAELTEKTVIACGAAFQDFFTGHDYAGLRKELIRRVAAHERHEKEAERLGRQLAPLEKERDSLIVSRQGLDARKAEEAARLAEQEKELAQVRRERQELFGQRETAAERARIKEQVRLSAEGLNALREKRNRCHSESTAGREMIDQRRRELAELFEQTGQVEQAFMAGLLEAGIASEEEFVAALLPRQHWQRLERLEQDLDRRRTGAIIRRDDSDKRLAALDAGPLTTRSVDEIQEERRQVLDQLEKKREEVAFCRQRLLRQEELQRLYREKAERLATGEREIRPWLMLNRLVGSADGQKFRRFAQGLTLEHLIALANTYLAALNDRYVIKRKHGEELGLEVMDSWQADAVRPTATLSGGESFLVSLALALGLSRLASRNVSIDSLFLDEGFGTLDSDTLETALAALGGLQASGKTIGLISHVEALKERIPVQIVVRGTGGGISVVEVAG
ncbi:MAG: AAA family ATPase [Thermodesulfobacteriota bacterium]